MNRANPTKGTKKIRTGSIARRINTAQAWRRFCRGVFLTVLITVLIAGSWCLLIEWAYGGEITNVSNRRFGGSFNWHENLIDLRNQNGLGAELKKYIRENDPLDLKLNTPFDGIEYRFKVTVPVEEYLQNVETTDYVTEPVIIDYAETLMPETLPEIYVPETEVGSDAVYDGEIVYPGLTVTEAESSETAPLTEETLLIPSVSIPEETAPVTTEERGRDYASQHIITRQRITVAHDAGGMLTVCTFLFGVSFLFRLACLLSCLLGGSRIIKKYLKPIDEIAVIADRLSTEVRSLSRDEARQNEPDLDSLENAINAIEDSDTRLQVHDAELGSLEAALNNMLKRLDDGKRKQIRFVDDASHELRTPIAVIQGYIQLLDRWGKEDEKVRDEAIEAIKTEAEHMKVLVDQLLFLARGEMDRHVLEKEELNMSEILGEIRDESIMLDENAEVHHEFSLILPQKESGEPDEYEPLMICADAAMMKQAIRILRDNAVKYTPDGGRITFKAYHRTVAATGGQGKQSVCIEISDTGIGIRPKELPRIFDRFYRGENVRANNSSGSGLGLSIAKWIIDEHGGIMEAISSEGVGTKMTIVMEEAGNVSRETI